MRHESAHHASSQSDCLQPDANQPKPPIRKKTSSSPVEAPTDPDHLSETQSQPIKHAIRKPLTFLLETSGQTQPGEVIRFFFLKKKKKKKKGQQMGKGQDRGKRVCLGSP
jgi:hypothetical protein